MTQAQIASVLGTLNTVILGKNHSVKLAFSCLLARGHLLIEDLPGVGKTTLAHALASTLGLSFHRVQFTSDMLPADILGVTIYDPDKHQFKFHRGPIFTQLLLADEINRASPRTQSALLEAMEEQQVTIEGESYPLTAPFFVIATQNPSHQIGTFALPESQLDRFLMRVELGYPNRQAERALLQGDDRRVLLKQLAAQLSPAELIKLQHQVSQTLLSEAIVDYLQALLNFTRESGLFDNGLSPRAGLGLAQSAKAWAMINGRDYVIPEDVQAVFHSIVRHRLVLKNPAETTDWSMEILQQVAIP